MLRGYITKEKKEYMATKKTVNKDAIQKRERDLLKETFIDLENELKLLRSSRRKLEQKMGTVSKHLSSVQAEEIQLRNEISELMKKETNLEKNRSGLKDKMTDLTKRIDKVKSIGRELKDI